MSAVTEQHVKLTAQLYQQRDTARRLLGDGYKAKMRELGEILQATADKDRINVLKAAIDVATKRHLTGIPLMLVMAAAVELAEPSKP